jgi:hypothetical protein
MGWMTDASIMAAAAVAAGVVAAVAASRLT